MAWLAGWDRKAEVRISNAAALADQLVALNLWHNCPRIEADGIFEWFTRPVYRYNGTNDRTYIGYYKGDDEKTVIRYWDAGAKTLSSEVDVFTSWGGGDDHSCPTVIVLQHQTGDNTAHNGKVLVADAEHNGYLKVRRSSSAETLTFDSVVNVESNDASYAHLFEASNGTVWLLYRVVNQPLSGHYSIYYRTSTDGGSTWSARSLLFDGGDAHSYVMIDYPSDGTELHCMFNIANHYEPEVGYSRYKNIWYAKYDVATAKWYKADGSTEITLPMNTITAGRIPDLVHETAAGHWEFLWDIRVINGSPYLISCDEIPTLPTHNDGDVFYHYYSGGSWNTETVCDTGVFGTYNYQAGAVLDGFDANVVYACVPDGSGKTQLQKWEKDGTWSKSEDITQASPGDHFRPAYVKNGAGSFTVLWCYTERYSMYSDGNWESSLFAYPGYNVGNNVRLGGAARSDFGDIRFTSQDGSTLIGYEGKGYIESKTDNWMANVLITVESIPALPDVLDIFAYYGNSSATYPADDTAERAYNAFIFFDDFSGSALDTEIWTIENETTVSVSDGALHLSDDGQIVSVASWGLGNIFIVKAKADEQDVYFLWLTESTSDNNNYAALWNSDLTYPDDFDRIGFFSVEDGGTQYKDELNNWDDFRNVYSEYFIERNSATLLTFGQGTHSDTCTTATAIPDGDTHIRFGVWDSSQDATLDVDWVGVQPPLSAATVQALNTGDRALDEYDQFDLCVLIENVSHYNDVVIDDVFGVD